LNTSEKHIARCLKLASKVNGFTYPNPMVGCVITCNNKIIGEGFHQEYGKEHAEVNAINSVKEKELLINSHLYVNLEPCSHFGKTPPCSDLIIFHKIPFVSVGSSDSNSLVAGKGIEKLRNAGCVVETKILEQKCRELNKRFYTFHEKKRPYIILKWAESKDGFIDQIRDKTHTTPTSISDIHLKPLVHKWRSEEQSIMIGTTTALNDNPQLTVRNWSGKNPTRIVIDKSLALPINLFLFDKSTTTIVFTAKEKESDENINYVKIDFSMDTIDQILAYLFQKNIISLMVEGGTKLLESFILQDKWDEVRLIKSNKNLVNGVKAPSFKSEFDFEEIFEKDTIYYYRNF